jgi:GDP-L-fucose synthase
MKEDYLLTGSLESTNEPYAIAKIAAIKLSRYYNEQYGTNFISVMPTNLYGPGDNFNLETSHVLPAIIRKFHLAKLLKDNDFKAIERDIQRYPLGFGLEKKLSYKDKKAISYALKRIGIMQDLVFLWGSGEPYREFLYVDDLADACIFLMENYDYKDIGEFVNIGTSKELKIKELARIVKDIVGFKGDIRWDSSKPDGAPRKLLDISRIKALGWEPTTKLRDGIKKAYDWYSKR